MRNAIIAILFGTSALVTATALAQTAGPTSGTTAAQGQGGPADLCQELLAYAEKKAAEPPEEAQVQAPSPAGAPPPRHNEEGSGRQGGGSIGQSSSTETNTQEAAPPATPVSPGAAPEAASSGHASNTSEQESGATPAGAPVPDAEFKLAGGITVQQVRETAGQSDRQACRDTAQTLRRAGADMPAGLIALAAYEPDPAKRQ